MMIAASASSFILTSSHAWSSFSLRSKKGSSSAAASSVAPLLQEGGADHTSTTNHGSISAARIDGTSPMLQANSLTKTSKTDRALETMIRLTGRESIVFRSCETLSIVEDGFTTNPSSSSENASTEQQEGMSYASNIKGVKSFVKFDVCQSENCFSNVDDARTTYVTSLADYVLAFSECHRNSKSIVMGVWKTMNIV